MAVKEINLANRKSIIPDSKTTDIINQLNE